MSHVRELDICCETLQACLAAQQGGADRIELCAALGEGGVTPGAGLLQQALATVHLPVHVLVRPRVGGFVYDNTEFRATCRDLEDAIAAGAAGVVVGLLTPHRTLDEAKLETLVRLAGAVPLTFHRAFDHVADQSTALERLIDLGFARVLTSGGKPTVQQGRDTLAALAYQARGRIHIAAGGGVSLANAASLIQIQGLDLHASLRRKPAEPGPADPLWQQPSGEVAVEDVRALSALVHADEA